MMMATSAKRRKGFDEALGQSLAALHAFGAPSFGFDQDNFIGRLAQSNRVADDWASFYWISRLEPQLRLATDRGLIDRATGARFDTLRRVLPERVGPAEPPRGRERKNGNEGQRRRDGPAMKRRPRWTSS